MRRHRTHLACQVHYGHGREARRYGARMIELVGDSSRDGEWALVRLRVDGDTIVEADAPGLSRNLEGLTLLEAAAVPGETLAADALANAIGPVVREAADPRRVAVAMSGGVDSAVALLHAGPSAVGVTLRLWLDPEGPSAERACCSPDAVIAAREACHALGRPHVTLDLREEFRRAIVEPFVRGYERGETPNPCIACNGSFRFAELLAFAERVGAARLATGHYARIVSHRGRLLLARAVDREKDQSYMLGRLDPAFLDRIWFPLGEQTKAATRAEAEAAGLAGCATRREPGGLLPRRRRLPLLPRAPRAERRGPDRGRGRARARQTRRGVALHARPAPRARRLVRGSALRAQDRRGDLDARRRAPGVARHDERLGPRSAVRRRRTGRGEAALPLSRGRRAEWSPRIADSASSSTSRPSRSRPGRPPSCTKATPWSGQG